MAKSHKTCMEQAEIIDMFGTYHGDPVYFKGRLVVPVSKAIFNCGPTIMEAAHNSPLSIHPGSTKMYTGARVEGHSSTMSR